MRDELGRAVHVTPHQWRHTYATRLINGDVSQEVVRRLLDHTTHTMTARYARLSQQTIRGKWEAARKVDIRGVDVVPPDGDLADAQWMRNNVERAKMALPNGYCTLPIQQNCEYANACLTCRDVRHHRRVPSRPPRATGQHPTTDRPTAKPTDNSVWSR